MAYADLMTDASKRGIVIGIVFLVAVLFIILLVLTYFMTDGFSFMSGIGASISNTLSELFG